MSRHVDRDLVDAPAPIVGDAQLMALLGVDALTEQDHQAQATASAVIQDYLERTLLRDTYTERHMGTSSGTLQLLEFPVIAITSIQNIVNGVAANDVTGYRLVRPTGMLLGWWGGQWGGFGEVEVVYEAGYDPMPPAIVTAFMDTFAGVKGMLAASNAGGIEALGGLVKKASVVGVGSVEYDGGMQAGSAVGVGLLSANAVALLQPYRNHGPVGVG